MGMGVGVDDERGEVAEHVARDQISSQTFFCTCFISFSVFFFFKGKKGDTTPCIKKRG
jgi:hypothetical protein